MTFKLLEKYRNVGRLGDNQISISKTQISFGKTIKKKMSELGYVEVYLDRKNNKIGFKPTKNMITGFKVRRERKRSLSVQSKDISKIIPMGIYNAKKENDIWVISVSEIKESK